MTASARLQPRRSGVVLGLLIGLAGVVLTTTPNGAALEEDVGLQWLFDLRGPVAPPDDVVIVAIDEQASRELALPRKPSEWSRAIHASLVRALMPMHPSVMAFDVAFEAPRDADGDATFAAAIGEAGNVVVAETLRRDAAGEFVYDQRIPPIEPLAKLPARRAPFALPRTPRVDAYWPFLARTPARPTLPALALQMHALPAYADFARSWRSESALPPTDALASASGIEAAMSSMHAAVLAEPSTVAHAYEAVDADVALTARDKRLAKALIGLYAGPDERRLNFYGPARTIRTISYGDILRVDTTRATGGALPRNDDFKGKAVFIGYSARTPFAPVRDDYNTVYDTPSELHMSGVEIAATAFANLLERNDLRPIGDASRIVALLAWGLLLGIAARALRPLSATLAVVALTGIYVALAVALFGAHASIVPLVIPVTIQAPLALLAGVALNYRDVRKEREMIKQAFGYFLPNAVVDQLAKGIGPAKSGHRLVYGACLYTDVERYSTISEAMSPTELAHLMNDYFAEVFAPIVRRGGVVSDVVGDAVLAIWASSSSDISLRRNACHAALEIVEALERFNAVAGRPKLRTRIGLHAGELLLGSIGAGSHFEYRAVGDIVNTATRMEGLNKHLATGVLASQDIVEGLDELVVRPVGSFVFVGKTKPLAVCELVGRRATLAHADERLSRRFDEALAAYRSARFDEAAERFAEILRERPSDGPSRFYLDRAQQLAASPPAGAWDGTVVLDKK